MAAFPHRHGDPHLAWTPPSACPSPTSRGPTRLLQEALGGFIYQGGSCSRCPQSSDSTFHQDHRALLTGTISSRASPISRVPGV